MYYYQLSREEVFARLQTDGKGLSSQEAATRLLHYGPNMLHKKAQTSPWLIFFGQFKSPLIIILLIATAISLLLGHIVDGSIVMIIVLLNTVFGFIQEYKAEKSIEALKHMMSLKAKVWRDNTQHLIDSSHVVPGDLIIVNEGDTIPADGYLLSASNLESTEAALTGESLPVSKSLSPIDHEVVLADQKNMLFSGTSVNKGYGQYIVTATGMDTEIGSIATMLDTVPPKVTHLETKLLKLSSILGIVALIICLVIFVTYYFINQLDLATAFLASIALAVAAVPEGLPAVVTISLGLGVNRMVKKNALMRKLPSVETLGAVTMICSDKTGTLTKNEMTVTQVYVDGQIIPVSGAGYSRQGAFAHSSPSLTRLLTIGLLCNHSHLQEKSIIGDPTEGCLLVSASKGGLEKATLEKLYLYQDEIPFDSSRKMMSMLYSYDGHYTSEVKGAPEILLSHCSHILDQGTVRPLRDQDKHDIMLTNTNFATQAMRVLGFAYKEMQTLDAESKKEAESDLIFVGLQAIIDPPRDEVKPAIQTCYKAGIQVMMITGDNLQTAQAIAEKLGIQGDAIAGSALTHLSDTELLAILETHRVFARVNPEHKQKLIKLLKQKGHVVAMTGDGVNDAPALKQADIGIAMGITGTDVSKESSDMILLDDNFATIVSAIEEGRGIYDNIKKFINFLLSTNLGEVLIIFITSLMGMPLPLTAIQVLWINLIGDGLPALALGVDPVDKAIMTRKPPNPQSNIIDTKMLTSIIMISIIMSAAVILFYHRWYEIDLIMARTGVLVLLIILEIMRIQMIRSEYGVSIFANKRLIGAVALSIMLVLTVIYTPLHVFFGTIALSGAMWGELILFALGTSIVGISLGALVDRVIMRRFVKKV